MRVLRQQDSRFPLAFLGVMVEYYTYETSTDYDQNHTNSAPDAPAHRGAHGQKAVRNP
jgi:hypothetical protein